MSNTPETERLDFKVSKPSQNRLKKMRRWIVFLVAFIIVGLACQQVWTLRLWEGLDRESTNVVTVESRLNALEKELGNQQKLHQEIDALRSSLQQERSLLLLDRIEERVDAGWQIWLAVGDSKPLLRALADGQRDLSQNAIPESQALRTAMAQDLATIKRQQIPDLQSASDQIDAVIASLDKLPLMQDQRLPKADLDENKTVTPVSDTLMAKVRAVVDQVSDEIWQSIKSMVRVQRLDRAEAGLIAPEQRVFLQQNLRLMLLDARYALIQRNSTAYKQSLIQVKAWLAKYYDGGSDLVKADTQILVHLIETNIDVTSVDLQATRTALAQTRAALLGGEDQQAASGEAVESTIKSDSANKPKGASE